ncbi:hypothetical protein H696_05684 [Fonticula alba]|uniref:Mediator of RNA polymerase II transcription subunit 5 n=1 Tax=Fonticula alba TaxID=691883 RepID=A0A058Z238_FONAL|nr:hypothetical protein H696_05684 [Fonticula alba]KCV67958.1 hypothetical protein H696_05684 [Fonticula alba]|eukprot:XP_009497778.1 hypothetical protein H696_05684 [Fonticula alba]
MADTDPALLARQLALVAARSPHEPGCLEFVLFHLVRPETGVQCVDILGAWFDAHPGDAALRQHLFIDLCGCIATFSTLLQPRTAGQPSAAFLLPPSVWDVLLRMGMDLPEASAGSRPVLDAFAAALRETPSSYGALARALASTAPPQDSPLPRLARAFVQTLVGNMAPRAADALRVLSLEALSDLGARLPAPVVIDEILLPMLHTAGLKWARSEAPGPGPGPGPDAPFHLSAHGLAVDMAPYMRLVSECMARLDQCQGICQDDLLAALLLAGRTAAGPAAPLLAHVAGLLIPPALAHAGGDAAPLRRPALVCALLLALDQAAAVAMLLARAGPSLERLLGGSPAGQATPSALANQALVAMSLQALGYRWPGALPDGLATAASLALDRLQAAGPDALSAAAEAVEALGAADAECPEHRALALLRRFAGLGLRALGALPVGDAAAEVEALGRMDAVPGWWAAPVLVHTARRWLATGAGLPGPDFQAGLQALLEALAELLPEGDMALAWAVAELRGIFAAGRPGTRATVLQALFHLGGRSARAGALVDAPLIDLAHGVACAAGGAGRPGDFALGERLQAALLLRKMALCGRLGPSPKFLFARAVAPLLGPAAGAPPLPAALRAVYWSCLAALYGYHSAGPGPEEDPGPGIRAALAAFGGPTAGHPELDPAMLLGWLAENALPRDLSGWEDPTLPSVVALWTGLLRPGLLGSGRSLAAALRALPPVEAMAVLPWLALVARATECVLAKITTWASDGHLLTRAELVRLQGEALAAVTELVNAAAAADDRSPATPLLILAGLRCLLDAGVVVYGSRLASAGAPPNGAQSLLAAMMCPADDPAAAASPGHSVLFFDRSELSRLHLRATALPEPVDCLRVALGPRQLENLFTVLARVPGAVDPGTAPLAGLFAFQAVLAAVQGAVHDLTGELRGSAAFDLRLDTWPQGNGAQRIRGTHPVEALLNRALSGEAPADCPAGLFRTILARALLARPIKAPVAWREVDFSPLLA